VAGSQELPQSHRKPDQHAVPNATRIWQWLLGGGLGLAICYVVLPYGLLDSGLYLALGIIASVSIALAVRRRDLFCPRSWLLLAAGLALCDIGNFIWYWLDLTGQSPFPSFADYFYLASYPLFAVSLWLLGGRNHRRDGSLSDALIVGISAAVLSWALLIEPYVHEPNLTFSQLLVAAGAPVMDLILLPLVLRLVFMLRTGIVSHMMLLVGWAAYLAADILFAYGNSHGGYHPGGPTDALWLLAYALFAAAAWHPSATIEPAINTAKAEMASRRFLILGGAVFLVPLLTLLYIGRNAEVVRVAAVASMLLFVLMMHRMVGLLRKTHRQAEELEKLSRTDPLTGAANRRHFDHELAREIARAERCDTPLTIAFLDLDHFKRFNDRNGHVAGDALLSGMVANWFGELRPTDLLARIGGEEFVVIFPDTDLVHGLCALKRIRCQVPYQQTCSAGLAEFQPGESARAFVERADKALYVAKNRGRNQIVVATDPEDTAQRAARQLAGAELPTTLT